jgi:hypothetical protein
VGVDDHGPAVGRTSRMVKVPTGLAMRQSSPTPTSRDYWFAPASRHLVDSAETVAWDGQQSAAAARDPRLRQCWICGGPALALTALLSSRSRTAGCALRPRPGVWRQPARTLPCPREEQREVVGGTRLVGGAAARTSASACARTGAGNTLAGSPENLLVEVGHEGGGGATGGPVLDACRAERVALHTSGDLASTEARRLLTADGGLDRVGPDSRLPPEGLGMSRSAVVLVPPGGRRGVGGRGWAAGGAGAGPGELRRADELDQDRGRRRWQSGTLLSGVRTRRRSRRRSERSER